MAKVRERKWSKMMRPELGEVYFGGYPSLKGTGARTKGRTQAEKMGGGGEVSPLRKGQQDYIDRLRAGKGGKTDTGGGGYTQKSSSLKNQKVKKRKGEKDTMEQDAQKQDALRKKAEKQEAQNQKDMEKLYGGWITPKGYHSKANIRKRTGMTGRTRNKKKKVEEQESWTPPPIEGIPRKRLK